jgi:hypothetical protein
MQELSLKLNIIIGITKAILKHFNDMNDDEINIRHTSSLKDQNQVFEN